MQSIGLTIEEIAIIYLALPFTTFLSPPLTGNLYSICFDKIKGKHKIIYKWVGLWADSVASERHLKNKNRRKTKTNKRTQYLFILIKDVATRPHHAHRKLAKNN